MHRFFVPPHWIRGPTVVFEDPVAHQLRVVLRMRPGARIVALDNAGWEYEVELVEFGKAKATCALIERRPATGEPTLHLSLYQCALKKDNFEWVLQKCAEIGVSRFVPVISQRTVITDIREAKRQRWERILTEAAEQSRRGRIPALDDPRAFDQAADEADQFDLALIPWERETARPLRDVLIASDAPARVAIFIGPEGGFTDEEIEQAAARGIVPVTLGPRILRAETAAVVAAAITMYQLE
jgi:16S rRNA (uracil1498-N3)-methyltransferase